MTTFQEAWGKRIPNTPEVEQALAALLIEKKIEIAPAVILEKAKAYDDLSTMTDALQKIADGLTARERDLNERERLIDEYAKALEKGHAVRPDSTSRED